MRIFSFRIIDFPHIFPIFSPCLLEKSYFAGVFWQKNPQQLFKLSEIET